MPDIFLCTLIYCQKKYEKWTQPFVEFTVPGPLFKAEAGKETR